MGVVGRHWLYLSDGYGTASGAARPYTRTRSVAAGGDQTLQGAVVTAEGGAAASEGGAVATSGGVAVTGPGPTIVVQSGGTLNYYADGLPQAAPEVRDHFEEGQRLQDAYEHAKAIAEFQAALATADTDSRRGALQLHIGISHYLSGRLPQAEASYTEALGSSGPRRTSKAGPPPSATWASSTPQRGDLERAEEHYKQALEIDRRIDNPLGQAQDLGNLGNVYAEPRRPGAGRGALQAGPGDIPPHR